jgi:DNA-binding IclR family transcriptional regulator
LPASGQEFPLRAVLFNRLNTCSHIFRSLPGGGYGPFVFNRRNAYSSVGKCLIAWLPKPEVESLLHQQGLKKRTPKTITGLGKLFTELEHVRAQGHAVDDEENSLGARCVAVPIFGASTAVIAALGVSGTLSQMDETNLPRILDALKETSRRVARQMQPSGRLAPV